MATTAKGQLKNYLRGEGHGKPFTTEELAAKFKTTDNNVSKILRELRTNNWEINQTGYATRGVNKPQYIAYRPCQAPKRNET